MPATKGQSNLGVGNRHVPAGPPGPPFLPTSAENGLSVDPVTGAIVLGDPLGATGPADLLNAREIAMNGNILRLSQTNLAGFNNWNWEIQNNFAAMADTVGQGSYILWSVDFPGNTGQYIGNDRTQPGWIPPFIIIQDTSPGGQFGRMQFNSNDALELTDAGGSIGLSVFQNGSVAIQPAGAIDPGTKFFVNGSGSGGGQMIVQNLAQQYLVIDDSAGLFQFGDINNPNAASLNLVPGPDTILGALTAMQLNMTGATRTAKISYNALDVLSLDALNGQYEIGDINAMNNGTFARVNDTAQQFEVIGLNGLKVSNDTVMIHGGATWADGAGANVGTLTNAPAVGNPTKWIPVDDDGTTRYIPAW